MGAKRSVDGRSQPYDVLLAAYQKKSIGRPNGKEHVSKKKGTIFQCVFFKRLLTYKSRYYNNIKYNTFGVREIN